MSNLSHAYALKTELSCKLSVEGTRRCGGCLMFIVSLSRVYFFKVELF